MKFWEKNPDTHDGLWFASGRLRRWARAPWFSLDGGSLTVSFFGLFGLTVDVGLGVFVSVGASWVGWVGVGYIPRKGELT